MAGVQHSSSDKHACSAHAFFLGWCGRVACAVLVQCERITLGVGFQFPPLLTLHSQARVVLVWCDLDQEFIRLGKKNSRSPNKTNENKTEKSQLV